MWPSGSRTIQQRESRFSTHHYEQQWRQCVGKLDAPYNLEFFMSAKIGTILSSVGPKRLTFFDRQLSYEVSQAGFQLTDN